VKGSRAKEAAIKHAPSPTGLQPQRSQQADKDQIFEKLQARKVDPIFRGTDVDELPRSHEEEVQIHEPKDDDGKVEQSDIRTVLHRLAVRLQAERRQQRDTFEEEKAVPG